MSVEREQRNEKGSARERRDELTHNENSPSRKRERRREEEERRRSEKLRGRERKFHSQWKRILSHEREEGRGDLPFPLMCTRVLGREG